MVSGQLQASVFGKVSGGSSSLATPSCSRTRDASRQAGGKVRELTGQVGIDGLGGKGDEGRVVPPQWEEGGGVDSPVEVEGVGVHRGADG